MTETNSNGNEVGMGDTVYDPEALGFGIIVTVDGGIASLLVSDPNGNFRADVPAGRLELVEAEQLPSYNVGPEQRPFSNHQ